MSEASAQIDAITSELSTITDQFPGAVQSALSTAFASGAASGAGAPDLDLPNSISSLTSAASNLTSALQGSLSQVTSSLSQAV